MKNDHVLFLLLSISLKTLPLISAIKISCINTTNKLNECQFSGNLTDTSPIEWVKHKNPEIITIIRLKNIPNLAEIPPEILSQYKTLESLDVTENELQEIVLKSSLHLEFINASKNKIKALNAKSFTKTEHLKEIDVSNNKITEVDEEAFFNLKFLSTINLSNNELVTIKDKTFFSLPKLKTINLSNNRIKEIKANLFLKNHLMREIVLKSNTLDIIIPSLFDGMQLLKIVNLVDNNCVSSYFAENQTGFAAFKNDFWTCTNNYNDQIMIAARADVDNFKNINTESQRILKEYNETSAEKFKHWSGEVWAAFICFAILFVVVITGTISTICVIAKLIRNPQKFDSEHEVEKLIKEYDDESFNAEIDEVVCKSKEKNGKSELFKISEQLKNASPEIIEEEDDDDEEIYDVVGTDAYNKGYYA